MQFKTWDLNANSGGDVEAIDKQLKWGGGISSRYVVIYIEGRQLQVALRRKILALRQ